MSDPVTVVGAGPAGLACAIALAHAGKRVVVHERAPRIGSRFHGDFQGLENWSDSRDVLDELRTHGIEATFDRIGVSELTAFDPRGEAFLLRGKRPLYYIVRRGDVSGSLDRSLLQQALAAGAQIRFLDPMKNVQGSAVYATGPASADLIAVGYVFESDMPDGDWLALGDDLAPRGYAYLLVHGGLGTVAVCLFADFNHHPQYLRRTVEFFRMRVGLSMRNCRRIGGCGSLRLLSSAHHGFRLFAGERAGFQDALAGFGIRYALRSGLLAARSLLRGESYDALWRRELLPMLQAGVANRFLYGNLGSSGSNPLLRRVSRGDAGDALHRLYRGSMLTRCIYPLIPRANREAAAAS